MTPSLHQKRAWVLFGSLPLVFSLFLVGFMTWETLAERETLLNREKSLLSRMTQVVSLETRDMFVQIRNFFEAADLWISSRPSIDPRTDTDFNKLVENFRNNMGRRIDIRMVNADGGLYYLPSKSLQPLADVKDRDYYLVQKDPARKGFFIGTPVKSRVTNQWGIPISYPLTAHNAGMAIIFAALELPVLGQFYESARPQPSGNVMLIKKDGTIMARAPFDEYWMARKSFDPENISFPSTQADGVVTIFNTQEKAERLLGYRTMEDYPLLVTVSIKTSDVLQTWLESLWGRFLVLLFGLGGIIFLSWRGFRLLRSLEKTTQKLIESNGELEKSNATKDKLFSVIAHDLRNPIGAINNLLEILAQDARKLTPAALDDFISILNKTSGNTYHLLENLLSWSKSNRNAIIPRPSLVPLSLLVDESFHQVSLSAQSKKIGLQKNVPLDTQVWADPEMLKTILRNLLSNAIKFTHPGGTIQVESLQQFQEVKISVIDSGVGMDEKTLSGLFSIETTQVHNGTAHERGSGLGLVLCRDFADKNQGKLEVESTLGAGTRFILTLKTTGTAL